MSSRAANWRQLLKVADFVVRALLSSFWGFTLSTELPGLDLRVGLVQLQSLRWDNLCLRFRLLEDWRVSIDVDGLLVVAKLSDAEATALSLPNSMAPADARPLPSPLSSGATGTLVAQAARWGAAVARNLAPFVTVSLTGCVLELGLADETLLCTVDSMRGSTSRRKGREHESLDVRVSVTKLDVNVPTSCDSGSSSIVAVSSIEVSYSSNDVQPSGGGRVAAALDVSCGDIQVVADDNSRSVTVAAIRAVCQRAVKPTSEIIEGFRRRYGALLERLDSLSAGALKANQCVVSTAPRGLRARMVMQSVKVIGVISAADAAKLVIDSGQETVLNVSNVALVLSKTINAGDGDSEELQITVGDICGRGPAAGAGASAIDWRYEAVYGSTDNVGSAARNRRVAITASIQPLKIHIDAAALKPVVALVTDLSIVANTFADWSSSQRANSEAHILTAVDGFQIQCGDLHVVVHLPIPTTSAVPNPARNCTGSSLVLRLEGMRGYLDDARSRPAGSRAAAGERGKCAVVEMACVAVDLVSTSDGGADERFTIVQASDIFTVATVTAAIAPVDTTTGNCDGEWPGLPQGCFDPSREPDVHAWSAWLHARTSVATGNATDQERNGNGRRLVLEVECSVQSIRGTVTGPAAASVGLLAGALSATTPCTTLRPIGTSAAAVSRVSGSSVDGVGLRASLRVAAFEVHVKPVAPADVNFVARCGSPRLTDLPLGFCVEVRAVPGIARSLDVVLDGGFTTLLATGPGPEQFEKTICAIGPPPGGPAAALPHIFSTVRHPARIFVPIDADPLGFCLMREVTSVGADHAQLQLDAVDVTQLVAIAADFQAAKELLAPGPEAEEHESSQPCTRRDGERALTQPSAIASLHIKTAALRFTHEDKAVAALTAHDVEAYRLAFGPALMQVCGALRGVSLTEMTHADALHRHIVRDIDADFRPSTLEFHCTALRGQRPLLEVNWDQARVIYAQRSTMTLVSFVRDHFLPAATRAWRDRCRTPTGASEAPVVTATAGGGEDENSRSQKQPMGSVLRMCISLSRFEFHLPLSSSGSDSLVLLVPDARLFCCYDDIATLLDPANPALGESSVNVDVDDDDDMPDSCEDSPASPFLAQPDVEATGACSAGLRYLRGPFVAAGLQLSQLTAARRALSRDKSDVAAADAAGEWRLPAIANDELAALDVSEISAPAGGILRLPLHVNPHPSRPQGGLSETSLALPFSLRLEIPGATICSWCNQNVMGEGLRALVLWSLRRVEPPSDATYAAALGAAGQEVAPTPTDVRNTTRVDVTIENPWLELSVAQGQYQAIVHLIQQNFPEVQLRVPDIFPVPPPRTVHLQEPIFGRDPMEPRLPLLSTVPVHFPCNDKSGRGGGRIVGYENTPEYYDLFERTLRAADAQEPLSAERPSSSSRAPVSATSETRSSSPSSSPRLLTFDDDIADRVPLWSYHHTHREVLFARVVDTADSAAQTAAPADADNGDDSTDEKGLDADSAEDDGAFRSQQTASLHQSTLNPLHAALTREPPSLLRVTGAAAAPPSAMAVDTSGRVLRPSFRVVHRAGFPQLGPVVLAVHFTALELHFFRQHYGGGNGIEVSAGTFVVAGADAPVRTRHGHILHGNQHWSHPGAPRSAPPNGRKHRHGRRHAEHEAGGLDSDSSGGSTSGDGRYGVGGLSAEAVPAAFVVFAPKALPQMNRLAASKGEPRPSASSSSPTWAAALPHIRYSQQGVGNLRRCVIDISDSVLVVHLQQILALVTYFVEPVHLAGRRAHALASRKEGGALDFKAALDVEVFLRNTVLCVPQRAGSLASAAGGMVGGMSESGHARVHRGARHFGAAHRGGAHASRSGGPAASQSSAVSALCITVDVLYSHAFRGFLRAGPGKITVAVAAELRSMFIAPIHQVQTVGSESLVAPCSVNVVMELMILPERACLQSNWALLSPWVDLTPTVLKPLSGVDPSLPSSAACSTVTAMRLVSFRLSPMQPTAAHTDGERRDFFDDGDGWDAPGYLHNFGADVYSDGIGGSPRPRNGSDHADNDDDGDGDTAQPRVEAYHTLQLRLSLKDVTFIQAALQQLGWSQAAAAEAHRLRPTVEERFQYFFATYRDVDNVPLLSELLVHVPLNTLAGGTAEAVNQQQSAVVVGVTDVFADVCDLRVTLRNNTYNVDMARLDLRELRFSYHRAQPLAGVEESKLHMAAGLRLSVWFHNEEMDVWEPGIEPFGVTAIAATDSTEVPTAQGADATTSCEASAPSLNANPEPTASVPAVPTVSQQRVRFDIYCEPIEVNAAQRTLTSLIRKLSLADVVTSSSVDLPPYRVINDLGVPVTCSISSGGAVVTLDEIGVGATLPIEVHHLADAAAGGAAATGRAGGSAAHKGSMRSRTVHLPSLSREHLFSVSFSVLADTFDAVEPVPVDRESCRAFKMRLVRSDRRIYTAEARNSIVVSRKESSSAMGKSHGPSPEQQDAFVASAISSFASQAVIGSVVGGGSVGAGLAAAIGAGSSAATATATTTASIIAAVSPSPSTSSPMKAAALTSLFKPVASQSSGNVSSGGGVSPASAPAAVSASGKSSKVDVLALTGPLSVASKGRDEDVPLALVSMRIKSDGGRELVLRSVLSIKNDTNRVFQLSVRRRGVDDGGGVYTMVSAEHSLVPGAEWNVPVQVAHPKAALFMRLDERARWFEVLHAFDHLIVQGSYLFMTGCRALLHSSFSRMLFLSQANGVRQLVFVLIFSAALSTPPQRRPPVEAPARCTSPLG